MGLQVWVLTFRIGSYARIGLDLTPFFSDPKFMLKVYILCSIALALTFSLSVGSASDDLSKPDKELYLLASDNQVKLLSQKLEYSVLNTNSIQLGNLLISTNNMKLIQKDQSTVIIEGPLQFLVGGTLILKDPHGRAVWSTTIKDVSELMLVPTNSSTTTNLRTESAQFELPSFTALIDRLTQSSFFTFCIFTETKTNRIQICTPNYSIQQDQENWSLSVLESTNKDNLVIVNGTEVNDHGIIQFDQNIKTVSLAAKLASGLSVEVKTDYIDLDLLDIFFDEPQSLVHLKLREKTKEKKVYPWNAQIALKEPFLYIEAFGQVPLRQELSINKDELPLPSNRPNLLSSIDKTYASSLTLRFQNQPNIALRTKTKGDHITKTPPSTNWLINNLKYGLNKPHLISIQANQKKFIGSYEVERGRGLDLGVSVGSGSQSSTVKDASSSISQSDSATLIQISGQKHFDSFMGSYAPFHQLHWNSHFSYTMRNFKASNTKASLAELDLGYRLNSNFHHSESSSTIKLGLLNQISTGSTTTNSFWLGLKLSYDGPNSVLKNFFGTNFETQLSAYPVCLTKDCKNSSLLNTFWQSRFDIREKYYWSWKLIYERYQFKQQAASGAASLLGLQLGFGLQI